MTPRLLRIYKEEYERKWKEEISVLDYEAWLNGQYVLRAIAAVMPKGKKYPCKPFQQEEHEEQVVDENPTKTAALNFANYAAALNKQLRKKAGDMNEQRN